ncbi:peptide chain release factor N(5)-glutamine methyltransferase [Galbibacter sp. BG1]|uniref:peptide chain release factor N(5)-glutamine methyltransferase n=1 Tax=Galbibacter sp. BG1 TaxID=1170699 RepID=UPI0015BA92FB|nr:peptide chain release factor N(5)-glutamine methyltransferase [Galbibacter sp. BG1]QLE00264.1 peptide chain release factor N(5)-glutamine methyltransferase [Galbibacter sp. BG1]
MKLGELREIYRKELKDVYPIQEINTFFNWLSEAYLGYKSFEVVQNISSSVEQHQQNKFMEALGLLKKEKPIQHILGKAYFNGYDFYVNEHTLIPRPETEELVSWILQEVDASQSLNILDIGTGTGCIPISLAKKLPKARISAVDISTEALKIAKKNAKSLNAEVVFSQVDILKVSTLENLFPHIENFDIIISNPPYVRNLEKAEIKNNVLKYEPETALFVEDNNALVFYEAIAKLAVNHLRKGGRLFFEINQYLGEATVSLVKAHGFETVVLKKDLFQNDRMIKAEK